MNENNIIPNSERTPEERKRIATAGGIASGEARRKKKAMKEWAKIFGALPVSVMTADGQKIETDYDGAVLHRQYQKAIQEGNVKSAYFIAQLNGEMEQNVNVSGIPTPIVVRDQQTADDLQSILQKNIARGNADNKDIQ